MSLPKHVNPANNRTASAPYNFVPLPDTVVKAVNDANDLPDHSTYADARHPHSGYFEVLLTTKSPLYVRCLLTCNEFDFDEEEKDRYGRKVDNQTRYSDRIKNTPDFFYTRNRIQPVIPGSSLRGMLRSLLEVVSYGKVQWVTDKKLFFRTVDDTVVGKHYNQRVVEDMGSVQVSPHPAAPCYRPRVEGGFFRIRPDGTHFIEECQVARVEVSDILAAFGLSHRRELYELGNRNLTAQNERNPNQTPKWTHQHQDIWADVDPTEVNYFFRRQHRPNGRLRHSDLYLRFRKATNLATSHVTGKTKGKLVLTGHIEFKHLAFLFVPTTHPNAIEVPNDPEEEDLNKRLVDRFHDDDQMTRWQASAFSNGQPAGAHRDRNGYLREGEPVFFLRENGQLTFFGRAQMFRLPYTQSPLDLVPPEFRRPEEIDYAEAMFGFVRTRKELDDMRQHGLRVPEQGSKARAYASRVFVTDARLIEGQNHIWFPGDPIITPRILATPKPTTFQHYLVQKSDNKDTLKHYGSPTPQETVIRGHKRYWHQGLNDRTDLSLDEVRRSIEEQKQVHTNDTQHTRFKPIKPEVQFQFRVYFENLSDRELGAFCWTLNPLGDQAKTYCHHLGMGKPLGMGAVKLETMLHLTSRVTRYGSLFNGDQWHTGATGGGESLADRATLEQRTHEFEQHILGELKLTCAHLSDLKRIGMLLKTMEWPGFQPQEDGERYLSNLNPPRPNTRYMNIQHPHFSNEYRERPVLPDPFAFGALTGQVEPTVTMAPPSSPRTPGGNVAPSPTGTQQQMQPKPTNIAGAEVESVKKMIRGLGGPGEVSRLGEIVNRIVALPAIADQRECAQTLQRWLKDKKLWRKEKHLSKDWHKKLEELLGEAP
jgi:CRISPR-associated protein (TIGR03986 family)